MKLLFFSTGISASLTFSALVFAGGIPSPGLEQSVGTDERESMHRDLDDYSNKVYPDQQKIEQQRQKMREHIKQLDKNGDSGISREEAEQRMPGLARHFDEIDRDNNGSLSREEILAAQGKIHDQDAIHEAELVAGTSPSSKKNTKRRSKPSTLVTDTEPENGDGQ